MRRILRASLVIVALVLAMTGCGGQSGAGDPDENLSNQLRNSFGDALDARTSTQVSIEAYEVLGITCKRRSSAEYRCSVISVGTSAPGQVPYAVEIDQDECWSARAVIGQPNPLPPITGCLVPNDTSDRVPEEDFDAALQRVCARAKAQLAVVNSSLGGTSSPEAEAFGRLASAVQIQRSAVQEFSQLTPPADAEADFDRFLILHREQQVAVEQGLSATDRGDLGGAELASERLGQAGNAIVALVRESAYLGGCGEQLDAGDETASGTTAEPTNDSAAASEDLYMLGPWEGDTTLRRDDGSTQTYFQALDLTSLNEGQIAGRATADYPSGFHCGGPVRLRDINGQTLLFDYTESDNPDCAPSSEISVRLTSGGELSYRETDPDGSFDIQGVMTRPPRF